MIALIFGVPGATGFDFKEVTGDTIKRLTSEARKLTLVPASLPVAKGGNGMLTVAEFCAERGVSVAFADMSRIGKRAAALSRKDGVLIGRAKDELFGEVNAYDPGMLALAFAQIDSADAAPAKVA